MEQKITFILMIIIIMILSLSGLFYIVHKYMIVNIIFMLFVLVIIALSILYNKLFEKKTIRIINAICIIVLVLMWSYACFVGIASVFIGGVMTTIDSYEFPNNDRELLKNVYYKDMSYISPPISVVYERELIFGIKCRSIIKMGESDLIESFDLEKEYKELTNKEKKFCYANIKR